MMMRMHDIVVVVVAAGILVFLVFCSFLADAVDIAVFVSEISGVFHSGNYGPPVGFCFDQSCQDEPVMDDPLMADYNVERRASDFADACQVCVGSLYSAD